MPLKLVSENNCGCVNSRVVQAAATVFTSVKRLPKYVEAKVRHSVCNLARTIQTIEHLPHPRANHVQQNKIIAAIDSKERYEERKHEASIHPRAP